ncbi:calcium uptake protein, mitochondrial-like [Iris pallida]|uniref:Calcium uptake protein, mitochondrial-like n=1 Tax=Iris pallida TaxID=29817 RepID=A0AAX6GDB3_IRIPA|nr:calcium uptake protein, mitochondrial-like [Iris pallida]
MEAKKLTKRKKGGVSTTRSAHGVQTAGCDFDAEARPRHRAVGGAVLVARRGDPRSGTSGGCQRELVALVHQGGVGSWHVKEDMAGADAGDGDAGRKLMGPTLRFGRPRCIIRDRGVWRAPLRSTRGVRSTQGRRKGSLDYGVGGDEVAAKEWMRGGQVHDAGMSAMERGRRGGSPRLGHR